MEIVWNNDKIQEWRLHLGYFSSHLVKKTFANSTQDYPGVRHEREVMPKKFSVERFPDLYDPLRLISRNKETFSVDLLEGTYSGKKRWGLVFYQVKYKLLAYYRLGSKGPTAALTLDAISQFIAEHGIPRIIITDSDRVLGFGK